MVVALALRLWQLHDVPLTGDEFSTIREAQHLGLNLSGILFFALLRIWMLFGQSVTWMRLLPVLIGVAGIPLGYLVGKEARGPAAGLILAALFAFHPVGVEFSRYLRQYVLYLVLSTAALAFALRVLNTNGRARSAWLSLGLTLTLLPFSQLLGAALALQILAMFYVLWGKIPHARASRLVVVGVLLLGTIALGSYPAIRGPVRDVLTRAVGASPSAADPSPIGLSYVQFAQLGIAFFVFALGNRVYPLWLLLSVPGLVTVAIGLLLGLRAVWRRQVLWLIITFGLFAILVFLVFDPLAPSRWGTSARYVLPAWPAMMLLVAVGAVGHRRRIIALGIVTLVCLGAFYSDRWAYGEAPQDWHAAADFVTQHEDANTLLLYDGRSAEPVRYYFPSEVTAESYWPYAQSGDISAIALYDRIVFVTNDFQDLRRLEFDRVLRKIEEQYSVVDGRTDGSLKEYAFQRKPLGASGYLVDQGSGQVLQPVEILGLEFDDLLLSAEAKVDGHPVRIIGAFSLPGPDGSRTRAVPLSGAPATGHLVLVSTVLGGAADGLVAQVLLHDPGGGATTLPLRTGIETAGWDRPCQPDAPCEPVVKWRKLVALVGQQAYPGAWRDFEASLAGTVLPLPHELAAPDEISFELRCNGCRFYVWAIALLP
jgi:hypothetical protein